MLKLSSEFLDIDGLHKPPRHVKFPELEEDESSEPPPVSIKEATESRNKLIQFFLVREGNYSKEVGNIMKVGHVLERLTVKSLVQKGLDNYFVVDEK